MQLYINTIVQCDSPEPWGLFFQDNATPQMEGLEELHNNIMFYLAITIVAVTLITAIPSLMRLPIYGWDILSNLRTTLRVDPVDTDHPNKVIEITLVKCPTGLNPHSLAPDQAYHNNSRCYDIGFQTLVNGAVDPAATYAVARFLRFSSATHDYYNHAILRLFRPTPWNLSVFNGLHVERDARGYYSYIPLPVHLLLIPGHVVRSNGQPIMDHNVVLHHNRFSAKVYHTPRQLDIFNAKVYHAQSDLGPTGFIVIFQKKKK